MRTAYLSVLGGALAVGLLGAAVPASAAPVFSLGGYAGPIEISFKNYESFMADGQITNQLSPGASNFGVFFIKSITADDGSNRTLWSSGQGGAFLSGVFNGITVKDVTPDGSGHFSGTATGGVFNIYLTDQTFNAGQGLDGYGNETNGDCSIGELCYHGITDVGGELALSLDFASGITSDPDVTLASNFDTTTLPTTGSGQAYLNVTGGSLASLFDTDGQLGGTRDFFLQNTFCPNDGSTSCGEIGDWALQSNDPIRGAAVPEPATVTMLGFGLLGMGYFARRRRQSRV